MCTGPSGLSIGIVCGCLSSEVTPRKTQELPRRKLRAVLCSDNNCYCYRIYYKRHADDPTIEYLPVLALLLKQVSKKYPNVIFSLEKMICCDDYVNCLLVFNSNCDITDIINLYKDTIEITRE